MTHELHFIPQNARRSSLRPLLNHFRKDGKYSIRGSSVSYRNDRTDAYFRFDISAPDAGTPDGTIATLRIDHARPLGFAVEAAFEIGKLLDRLACDVIDPQAGDVAATPYDRERFLDVWEESNEAAVRSALDTRGRSAVEHTMPSDDLGRSWQWNFQVFSLQDDIGTGVLCPRVMYILMDGRAATAVLWPEACAAVLPHADFYVLTRPRRSRFGIFESETLVITRDQAEPALAGYRRKETMALPCWLVDTPHAQRADWLSGLAPACDPPTEIPFGAILENELIDKCLTRAST